MKRAGGEAARAAVERGRRLFGWLGCLGCHTNLEYRADHDHRGPADSLGVTWIAGDLAEKLTRLVEAVQQMRARKLKAELAQVGVTIEAVSDLPNRLANVPSIASMRAMMRPARA